MKQIGWWLAFIFIYCPLFGGWLVCHLIAKKFRRVDRKADR